MAFKVRKITPFGQIDLINAGRNVLSVLIFFSPPKGGLNLQSN